MVGLSVVLEGYKDNTTASSSSQVVSKASMIIKPPSPTSCSPSPVSPSGKSPFSRRSSPAMLPATGFLDCCFLCKQKLLPGKDIYMYKGFCSVECRCRQIVMDEEEQAAMKPPSSKRDHCSLAAMKPQRPTPSSAAAPPPPPPKARRGATGNRPNAFAY